MYTYYYHYYYFIVRLGRTRSLQGPSPQLQPLTLSCDRLIIIILITTHTGAAINYEKVLCMIQFPDT